MRGRQYTPSGEVLGGADLIRPLRRAPSPEGKAGEGTASSVSCADSFPINGEALGGHSYWPFAGNCYEFTLSMRGAGGSAPCRVRAEPAVPPFPRTPAPVPRVGGFGEKGLVHLGGKRYNNVCRPVLNFVQFCMKEKRIPYGDQTHCI